MRRDRKQVKLWLYLYGPSYRIRKGIANKIEDYVCGERASRKLEKDVRRAEETCGKKYIEFERGRSFQRVFREEEGKSECEVSANETRVGSNEDAKFGDERDARAPGGGGE